MPEHEIGQKLELAARITFVGWGAPFPYPSEELTVGECVRELELGTFPPLRVLFGRFHLRVPPRDVRREREWCEPSFGLVENRPTVVHQAAVDSTTPV
jgi:hypothetical protein